MTAYGTETMHVLRAEKGYIIVGQDTDGTVTPDDAGLGWAIGKSKPDFVGKRSLARPAMRRRSASSWSGCSPTDPQRGARGRRAADGQAGARDADAAARSRHLLVPERRRSAARSPWDSSPGGARRMGETLYVATARGEVAVEVTASVFYDPSGARIHG